MKEFLKVGVSGVRGVVGASFTPQLVASFGRAFASYVGRGSVVVGRDTRTSGPAMECALLAGLQSAGCTPLLAGVVPTPTICLLTATLGARGGIVITASHNAAEWNALKFIGSDGLFLRPQRAGELYDIYHQGGFELVSEEHIPAPVEIASPMSIHAGRVLAYVNAEAIRRRRFKVAVDCCNGVGAIHTRGFLEQLGCDVVLCHDTPNGIFERDPEPLPENLGRLSEQVRRAGCCIGFAQDPDGDRLAIVDENGAAIGEDLTLAFAVRQVLGRHGKGPVAINQSTSRSVQWVAEQHGVPVRRTRIGEIHVVEEMREIGAVVGGEGNGGVIVPAIHPCRDSYTGMALVLEMLADEGRPVSAIRADIPRYYLVKDKIRLQGSDVARVLRRLRHEYRDARVSLLDGIYVERDDGWLHVRASNTEAVLRVNAEAATPDAAREMADALKRTIASML